MTPDFNIKFRNKKVADQVRGSFDAVNEQNVKQDGTHGAVFCQLRECDFLLLQSEPGDKLQLTGSYLPPKWATRIGRVLKAYEDELKETKSDSG